MSHYNRNSNVENERRTKEDDHIPDSIYYPTKQNNKNTLNPLNTAPPSSTANSTEFDSDSKSNLLTHPNSAPNVVEAQHVESKPEINSVEEFKKIIESEEEKLNEENNKLVNERNLTNEQQINIEDLDTIINDLKEVEKLELILTEGEEKAELYYQLLDMFEILKAEKRKLKEEYESLLKDKGELDSQMEKHKSLLISEIKEFDNQKGKGKVKIETSSPPIKANDSINISAELVDQIYEAEEKYELLLNENKQLYLQVATLKI